MTNLYLTATTTDSVSMLATFIPLILMIVIFYFLLIRPQKKRDKEVQKMRENIEIADEIVTIGGIIGRVVSIKDDTVVIETASDHSKITWRAGPSSRTSPPPRELPRSSRRRRKRNKVFSAAGKICLPE